MSNTTDVNDATAHAATSTKLTNWKTAVVTFLGAIETACADIGTSQKEVQIPDCKQDALSCATKVANAIVEG
tara:strand:- start:340 stop:555 length:216 start_codon:yes stop_codon:yes gene_type:complete